MSSILFIVVAADIQPGSDFALFGGAGTVGRPWALLLALVLAWLYFLWRYLIYWNLAGSYMFGHARSEYLRGVSFHTINSGLSDTELWIAFGATATGEWEFRRHKQGPSREEERRVVPFSELGRFIGLRAYLHAFFISPAWTESVLPLAVAFGWIAWWGAEALYLRIVE